MVSVHVKKIGFMLRVHRRSDWLPVIVSQMKALARGRQALLVVMYDRPSTDVISWLDRLEARLPANFELELIESPAPIRTSQGCKWTETVQHLYAPVKAWGANAAMLWDDDLLYSDTALMELRAALELFEHDRLECEWLNTLDPEAKEYDAAFLTHRATAIFRVYQEDDWSDILTRTVAGGGTHSPIYVARSNNFAYLQGHALHMGYCTPEERESAWANAKMSGQTCAYFRQLCKEPTPVKCKGPDETTRYLKRETCGNQSR